MVLCALVAYKILFGTYQTCFARVVVAWAARKSDLVAARVSSCARVSCRARDPLARDPLVSNLSKFCLLHPSCLLIFLN